ncbi:hypothetical protein EDD53_0383 [Pacificibacter maritimus]|uniref:Uncharacterized protein n=1 Tax=Pacificibacter maritimus TaxID=762213 RepID=A0A3N4V2F5_9RHOB|nr:hypothetical protein [Pacificibacter maritimus]RPE71267.1 hypothetical protein EDD53_0383 [Pacificibacter maritimus]
MQDSHRASDKLHYICQTYTEKKTNPQGQGVLEIGKQFQYTSAFEAEGRAEREFRSKLCVGADAYMVSEDPETGEVSTPTFLARLGHVPEFEAF